MRQYLRPADVANTLRMTRSQFDGALVLVEGQGSDTKFFKPRFRRDTCRLLPAHGKENLYAVVKTLDAESFAGLLGIADADRDRLLERRPPSPDILLTDGADLESMLFHSPALDKVLNELGSEPKIHSFEANEGCGVREALARRARPLGALRLISERDRLALTFRELRFKGFLNKKLELDLGSALGQIRGAHTADAPPVDWPALEQEARKIADDPAVSSVELCNGHDLTGILSVGLTRRLGSRKPGEVGSERLETALRLAYESEYFRATGLFADIRSWEERRPPYLVLA